MKKAPNQAESAAIHELFLRSQSPDFMTGGNNNSLPHDFAWMKRYQKTEIMHSQNRNVHNKIFGGFLMRLAFEQGVFFFFVVGFGVWGVGEGPRSPVR